MSIEDEDLGQAVLDRLVEKLEELEDDDVFIEEAVFASGNDLTRETVANAKRTLREIIAHVNEFVL